MPTNLSREQLASALRLSRCSIDLDTALADPVIARLLERVAQAQIDTTAGRTTAAEAMTRMDPWSRRLRRLAGSVDHQAIRAGDTPT